MLIGTQYIATPLIVSVRFAFRNHLEIACKDLAGYRDIETYIRGDIAAKTLAMEMLRSSYNPIPGYGKKEVESVCL